ncbi:MAG TPA: TlpA disulfide reductase family protein [Bacteroidales bacterium]|nr:TlpA disulfide reductase family protein [Paludibacteraceae bacterium]HPT14603.1 TlpA disulfide reductase family protein [Bacteroidales bacterium]
MKKNVILLISILWIFIGSHAFSQESEGLLKRIPSVKIKDAKGNSIDASSISNFGKPFIICFWKTCCKPPLQELDAISEVYEDWQDETGVVLYAVSVDDARTSAQALPYANGQGYEFEILLDPNSDLKRAMNVNLIPSTFICDGKGNIIWQKTMYVPGDENEIFRMLKHAASTSE